MKQFTRFFNSLPLPNAITVLAAALGLIYSIWHFVFWQPVEYKKNIMQQQIKTLQFEMKNLNLQLKAAKKIKPPANTTQKELFTANEVANILKKLIGIRQNLNLMEIQILPSQTIPIAQSNKTFFLNSFSVKFTGTYFSAFSYLKALEKEKIPFFWDSLKYKVTTYPYGEISVNVHVLSY